MDEERDCSALYNNEASGSETEGSYTTKSLSNKRLAQVVREIAELIVQLRK